MTGTIPPYDLRATEEESSLEIPAGTSLLVTAPLPVSREFVLGAVRRGLDRGEGGVVMTTDEPAAAVLDAMGDSSDRGGTLQIIDCQTDDIGTGEDGVQNVDTPRNLTDIGIAFKNTFDEFEAAGVSRARFGLLSLSVILTYVDRETVYRFCQTLGRGLASEDAVGLFHLTPEAHDDQTVNTLRRAFDGTVEFDAGGESVRVTGVEGVAEEWRGR